jgi:hypothetical protein
MYSNHNLLTEDRIYIKNFNSGLYQLDNYMNSQNGLLVGAPPTQCGNSQKKETGEVINSPNFYLDPFITFNDGFKVGTINRFTLTKTDNVNAFILSATISFPFGQCIISNTIYINTIPQTGLQISDTFVIGIFSGVYLYKVSTIDISSILVNENIYIHDESATLQYMQTYNSVYIAKRRIIIPLRMRSIINKVTNYITPI